MGVALAFGLTLLTMAYAIGHISGAHLNPAVSLGLVTPAGASRPAILSRTGCSGHRRHRRFGVLYIIASGKEGFARTRRFRLQWLRRRIHQADTPLRLVSSPNSS